MVNGLPAVGLAITDVADKSDDGFSSEGNEGTNEKETQSQIIVSIN
jgi:hypothetical protein